MTGDLTNNIWQGIMLALGTEGFANITELMSNIASSSTVAMRQGITSPGNYHLNQSFIYGDAFFDQYYVDIRWVWLTPVVVVTLISSLFFLFIVHRTRKLELEPWKQSILPIIYHGLSERPEDGEYTTLRRLPGMSARARETVVEMSDDGCNLLTAKRQGESRN